VDQASSRIFERDLFGNAARIYSDCIAEILTLFAKILHRNSRKLESISQKKNGLFKQKGNASRERVRVGDDILFQE
jgi:hypothetical protein